MISFQKDFYKHQHNAKASGWVFLFVCFLIWSVEKISGFGESQLRSLLFGEVKMLGLRWIFSFPLVVSGV